MDEEEKTAAEKIAEFLGEEIDLTEDEKEIVPEEIIPDESLQEPQKKLNLYEFHYTEEGNVLMSKEAYEQIMSKFFGLGY